MASQPREMNALFIAFRNATYKVDPGELSVLLIATSDTTGARWFIESRTATKPTMMNGWTVRKVPGHTQQSGVVWETREPEVADR